MPNSKSSSAKTPPVSGSTKDKTADSKKTGKKNSGTSDRKSTGGEKSTTKSGK